MMCQKNCKMHWAIVLGLFGVLCFILEFLWNYVLGAPELREFHMMLLRTYVLGFTGMNVLSFILGVVEWFIFGAILGGIIQALSSCCKCMKGNKEGGHDGCGHCKK